MAMTSVTLTAWLAYRYRRRWNLLRRRPVRPGTLLDPRDAHGVVTLVRAVDGGDGTDALVARLERLLTAFPPDELMMRRLSLLQQAHAGRGDAHDRDHSWTGHRSERPTSGKCTQTCEPGCVVHVF